MKLGAEHLAPYGSARSRHDFTQRQLMACLILKSYLKTSYRGLMDFLEGHGRLRGVLGLEAFSHALVVFFIMFGKIGG